MKRTKLCDRQLPVYSRGEEIMNMTTHIVGGAVGIIALILCVLKAAFHGGAMDVFGAAVYGISIITLYTMSSVYHGLRPGMAKKVLQVIDHCTIYFLIAGSYTPVLLSAMLPVYPKIAIGLLAVQWILASLAAVFTAIDLHQYRIFSMICYIGMGWGIVFFLPQTLEVVTLPGFILLLAGGIAYTIGAVLYGIGAKRKWMHSVFHIFVVLGTVLQFFCIILYVL